MSTFFSAVTFRSLSFAVLGYIFFFQSNCHRKEIAANQVANQNANVNSVNSNSNLSQLSNTNGYFVLFYGDGKDEEHLKRNFERIRETQPAFVVVGYFGEKPDGAVDLKQAKQVLCVLRGGSATECVKNPSFAVNHTGIKTIYYVTANQQDSIVNSQVKSVMELGYDGIFFDETNHQTEDSQNNRYKNFADSVHHFNNEKDKKIVIVNPGVSNVNVCRMFEYADIVSVENHWNKEVPQCGGIEKSRWLAVQGDPSGEGDYAQPPHNNEGDKAIKRLNCFRKNGGLWYFTTGWNDKGEPVHWRLPEFLEKFAVEAKKESVNCSE